MIQALELKELENVYDVAVCSFAVVDTLIRHIMKYAESVKETEAVSHHSIS